MVRDLLILYLNLQLRTPKEKFSIHLFSLPLSSLMNFVHGTYQINNFNKHFALSIYAYVLFVYLGVIFLCNLFVFELREMGD